MSSSSSILPFLQAQINRYGLPIIFSIGLFGNILIVILFARHHRNSCAMYILCAAVMNNIYLAFNTVVIAYTTNHKDPINDSVVYCKLRNYFFHVWGQTARSFIVLACVDRYLLTTNNERFRNMNKPSFNQLIVGIVIIVWYIIPIHLPILQTISNGACGLFGVYYIVYYTYFVSVTCLIPPILMGAFGFLAYRNMQQLHARIQPGGRTANDGQRTITIHSRDRALLRMTIAESVVYVTTMFIYPFIILETVVTNYIGIHKSTQYLQIESFLYSIGYILLNLNSAAPFYIYIAMSKVFRKDFKELIIKWKHRAIRPIDVDASQRIAALQT